MVLLSRSSAAVIAALLASTVSTEAAYGRNYLVSRPSMALGSRMFRDFGGYPSLFSRDVRRDIRDVDEIFRTVMGDIDERFYEPLALQRMGRPYYLLQGRPSCNALAQAQGSTAKTAFGITQDDKQIQIAVDVPGAKASDINLQLDEDGRRLTISGEMKREEEGISVHSRFERSFTLNRDTDTSQISAQMDNGVLTITAPKYEEAKKYVRRIDVVENEKLGTSDADVEKEEGADVTSSHEKEESREVKPGVDESVIDFDEN
mmetsp:Transcript_24790/g.39083  ORF Transcript_24790/g.39083 Transcript_24790/m.39083 type:complete len:261 (+) Transcript_24790:126-908(+)|eukprot:CAMPEP_0201603904 /NCGR_PEP_ID=MMETSP0492-20130828/4204_1 /ASSEMBLY_ACC=CAM_ASM_000837 /TAXON_ID=420259 /ORGANISM="Thalassiosira gravida, Strain GMp14c1" /LENGTH=260 /DNA_ID=CAMNT_0048067803 /DNA_START=108 /DNA_END=890 /DNA_ORIENTATION=-